MSIEGKGLQLISCRAAGTIRENRFVTLDTSNTAYPGEVIVSEANDAEEVYGVACNAATAAGQAVTVCIAGWGKLVTAGATPGSITVGSEVDADDEGCAVVQATALANVGGKALAATSTAADDVSIIVRPHSSVKAAS